MSEPSKEELLKAHADSFDTESLHFTGARGARAQHLARGALEAALAVLPALPKDRGRLDLMVARGPEGQRYLPQEVTLTVTGGMPGDRWVSEERYGPEYQLAATRTDVARLVANGQPLELHGDNLFLSLELSVMNLPAGSLLRLGQALLRVTPQAHNGCKKWVQRFGLSAMQLNLAPAYRELRLRGIYFQVVEDGRVARGDTAEVLERPARA